MPVVISFLNAFTGLAAASAGFVLDNNVLIIGGTLVGASGTLLTLMMGKAMNRSVWNVLFGAFGAAAPAASGGPAAAGPGDGKAHRATTAEEYWKATGGNINNHNINRRVEFRVNTSGEKEMSKPDGPKAGDCHKKKNANLQD